MLDLTHDLPPTAASPDAAAEFHDRLAASRAPLPASTKTHEAGVLHPQLRVPLRVEPGSAPRRVDVVLTRTKPADAPVTTVTGSTGQAGFDVELVDLVHGRRATLVAATTTDASGVFRFENVVPGFYRINLPPAERVVDYLVVGADEVTVELGVAQA